MMQPTLIMVDTFTKVIVVYM